MKRLFLQFKKVAAKFLLSKLALFALLFSAHASFFDHLWRHFLQFREHKELLERLEDQVQAEYITDTFRFKSLTSQLRPPFEL